MPETIEQQTAKAQIREIAAALDSGMFVHVRRMLFNMPACDIALLLESSPPKSRMILWQLVDHDFYGEILEELSEEVRNGIIAQMGPEKVALATESMDDDDLAEVLRSLPDSVYQEVIRSMDVQDRNRAEQALSYMEETAGSIMNTDTITIRPDVSVDVILRYLRLKGELPEGTDQLFVVDKHDMLMGVIPLSLLVTSIPNKSVREVMETDLEAIHVNMGEAEVAQLFERHNWISAPVIDDENQLLGRITIDDVVDIIREEAEHSMMSMAGLDDEHDTFAPVKKSIQGRSIWLGVNLLTVLFAAFVMNFFEPTFEALAVLAILNNIVPSMGGVAGNQTLTLVIRGLAVGHITSSNSRWLLGKEFAIGMLNGLIWAILISGVVAIWKNDIKLGAVLAFAMMVNLVAAAVSGVLIPLVLKRMNIDPALAGGVVLTTITDIVGAIAFLGTATLFLI
ncbi:magnesium transporter [Algicola sagamiensis]|uniref:magnesium transporter n=1 Tax=Algicola sagamiensis TaxID=163869 RepID=UPI000362D573|nr:magnesium transporter [Algicola sagamiensis]